MRTATIILAKTLDSIVEPDADEAGIVVDDFSLGSPTDWRCVSTMDSTLSPPSGQGQSGGAAGRGIVDWQRLRY